MIFLRPALARMQGIDAANQNLLNMRLASPLPENDGVKIIFGQPLRPTTTGKFWCAHFPNKTAQ